MAQLLGTLGSLGTSLIGSLLSKGVETVGDVATHKLSQWKRENTAKSIS